MFYFNIKIFKMKKDYLHEGAIADTADLVVLGAYFGTGNKGKKSSPLRNVFTIPLITNLEAEVFLECSNSLDYNTARIKMFQVDLLVILTIRGVILGKGDINWLWFMFFSILKRSN